MTDQNKLVEALRKLFRALFGKKNGNPSEFMKESLSVSETLSDMRDSCIKDGNVLEAYMFESQRLSLEAFRDQVMKGENGNKDLNISSQDILKDIESKMSELKSEEEIKDAFQDYHNHDSETIANAKESCTKVLNEICDHHSPNTKNIIMSVADIGTDKVEQHMNEVPASPAEEMGIAPEKDEDMNVSNGVGNDRDRSSDRDIDPSPEFAP